MTKLPSLTEPDLSPWFDRSEIIHACVAQLDKDLAPYGIQVLFSGNIQNAYQELFDQLEPQISGLKPTQMQSILYRVDVSEAKVSTFLQSGEAYGKTMTRLILWREFQKVVIRHLISSGKIRYD